MYRSVTTVVLVAAVLLFIALHLGSTPASAVSSNQEPKPQPSPSPSPPEEEIDPEDVVRVKTVLVNSPVLVVGRDGKFVPTLRNEDFQIFEDGIKQDVSYFAPVNKPFTVALVIDTSRSARFRIQDIQDAADSFVDQMREGDQALVIAFGSKIQTLAEATSDKAALKRAINAARDGGGSRVYDAIHSTLQAMSKIEGRKAVILLSDGVDTASTDATAETTLRGASRSDLLIYPIQFNTFQEVQEKNPARKRRPAPEGSGFSKADYLRADAYLHRLAEATGAPLYPAYDSRDLGRAVADIVEELHNEYSIGYYPKTNPAPGEVRRIEIKVNKPQLVVRARTGYVIDETGNVAAAPRDTESETSSSAALEFMPVPRTYDRALLPLGARWVCEGPNVPSDFAVVKEGYSFHCPASSRPQDQTNAWFIRKPNSIETMCKGFMTWRGTEVAGAPIPAGYVVTSEVDSMVCAKSSDPGTKGNAWTIRIPTGRETICKGCTLPRGFVVIGEKFTQSCPEKLVHKNAWVIDRKSGG